MGTLTLPTSGLVYLDANPVIFGAGRATELPSFLSFSRLVYLMVE